MDTQIWYAIFSTICGGVIGAFDRLGEVVFLEPFCSLLLPLFCYYIKIKVSTFSEDIKSV